MATLDRDKALDMALAQIDKQFGKGSVMRLGDSPEGVQARLMRQALRKITGALNNSGTTAIFINQLREKVGVVYGSPEVTTGGRALKFYSSVRLDVRRIETLKQGTEAVGSRVR